MDRARALEAKGYTYSYDMLGEAARTDADAQRYAAAYARGDRRDRPPARPATSRTSPGISVKLSALHPRYEWTPPRRRDGGAAAARPRPRPRRRPRRHRLQHRRRGGRAARPVARRDRGAARRPPARRLGRLRRRRPGLRPPRRGGDRLPRRARPRATAGASWCGWSRAPTGTARSSRRRSAACPTSRSSPASPRPTSATSPTPASCSTRATASTRSSPPTTPTPSPRCWRWPATRRGFEFQRLHGMGEALHEIVREREGTRCRIYAPVGAHRDLLAYLVRRLLENGANSSFVNQIVDKDLPPEAIAADPLAAVEALRRASPNPDIRRPAALFAPRRNSAGWNVNEPASIAALIAARERLAHATAGRRRRPSGRRGPAGRRTRPTRRTSSAPSPRRRPRRSPPRSPPRRPASPTGRRAPPAERARRAARPPPTSTRRTPPS